MIASEHIDALTFRDNLLKSAERMRNILELHQYAGETMASAGCGPVTPVPIYITSYLPWILNVIFHDPATIVFWSDGSKTVVKCQEGDTFSKETGLAMAIAKKALGNKGRFNETFKQWIPEYSEDKPQQKKEPDIKLTDYSPTKSGLLHLLDDIAERTGKNMPDNDVSGKMVLARWKTLRNTLAKFDIRSKGND